MSFWSGDKLKKELKWQRLITNEENADVFNQDKIDCAAYTLTLGASIFITTDKQEDRLPKPLEENEQFRIPPGQFAFLMTHEIVQVPKNALAFISMKARYKFQGLVNVSGFHVDPGWKGKLVFTVYNAGPATVTLQQGMDLFLIWYADLNQQSSPDFSKNPTNVENLKGLNNEWIGRMSGPVVSPMNLSDRLTSIEHKLNIYASIFVVVVAAFLGPAIKNFFSWGAASSPGASQSTDIRRHAPEFDKKAVSNKASANIDNSAADNATK